MKSILLLITVFSIAILLFSCRNNSLSSENYIMLDQTELYFNHLSIDQIKRLSVLEKDKNLGEITHIQGITELRRTDMATYSVPDNNPLIGNEIERKNEVEQYYSQIDSALNSMKSRKAQRNGSSILIPLFENLNLLSASNAQFKKFIINSDLDDNMHLIESKQNLFDLIRMEPDNARATIMNKIPLKDLFGIEIIILYLPQNKVDDAKFEILSNFYKVLFESKGANVKITGTI